MSAPIYVLPCTSAGAYIADMVVEGKVILELKSVRVMTPAMETQLINFHNEIYRRHLNFLNKKFLFKKGEKFSLALLNAISPRAINHLTVVKQDPVLSCQRRFIKNIWSYKHKSSGRKSITRDLKNLILEIKYEYYLWSCKKIANELKKINIDIHYTTVNRILGTFRKQGLIQPNKESTFHLQHRI